LPIAVVGAFDAVEIDRQIGVGRQHAQHGGLAGCLDQFGEVRPRQFDRVASRYCLHGERQKARTQPVAPVAVTLDATLCRQPRQQPDQAGLGRVGLQGQLRQR